MDIRKKILSIVGVLALTMSMGAGMASAQETPPITSNGTDITFIVTCAGSTATGASSATIGRSSGTGDIVFPIYDAAAPGATGTVSTDPGAFRITINLYCATSPWYVTAAITDFETDATPPLTIDGNKFQLNPVGTLWTTDGTNPAENVSPASTVLFPGTAAPYTSSVVAQSPGTATDPSMYMDFTGQLTGLDNTIVAGEYTAEVTVTFATGTP